MSRQTVTTDYRNLDDEALMTAAASAAEGQLAAIIAEARRRDRAQYFRNWHQARNGAIRAEWFLFAHNQYLAADWECRGNLLSKAGLAAGIDPFSLWSGPGARVERYASEELRDFWLVNQRVTPGEFAAQWRRARRAEREAADAGDDARHAEVIAADGAAAL